MPRIFISTAPFGEADSTPLRLLEDAGISVTQNPLGHKLSPEQVAELAKDYDALIAGTENLMPLLENNPKIQLISRVGIGLDSVPLQQCRKQNITVCYTPDAVTMAVVELTLGLMVSLTRHVGIADRTLRAGTWKRFQGKRLEHSSIGLIGFGRVGSRVAGLLAPFRPEKILVHDIQDKSDALEKLRQQGVNIEAVSLDTLCRQSDIVSLHVPLYSKTRHLVSTEFLSQMKSDAFLINTARGAIVDETALVEALQSKSIAGAAVDVFEKEPYHGALAELDNTLLTHHMGSCSYDCRLRMESEAAESVVQFFKKEPLLREVPEEEYAYQG